MISELLVEILGAILIIALSVSLYCQRFFRRFGIPSPYAIPLIGNLGLFIRKGVFGADNYLRKKYGNLYGYYLFNTPNLCVADAAMIREICETQCKNFPNRARSFYMGEFIEKSVSITKDDHWRFTRSILNPMFSEQSIQQFLPKISHCVGQLRRNVDDTEPITVDITCLLSAYVLDCLLLCGFSLDIDSLHRPDHSFVHCVKAAVYPRPNYLKQIIGAMFPSLEGCLKDHKIINLSAVCKFSHIIEGSIKDRKQCPAVHGTDFLAMFTATQSETAHHSYRGEKRGLTDDEVKRNALALILSGYGTASTALTWCFYCLTVYPECQKRLRDELDRVLLGQGPVSYEDISKLQYLDMFYKETLRMFPPPARFSRNTSRDTMVCGHHLSEGLDIYVPVYAIHHDPEKWPEPETFNPERFSPQNISNRKSEDYVPFGFGPRSCIGRHFGTLICKAALVDFVRRYKMSMSPKTQIPPPIANGPFVKPSNSIYIVVEPL